ncbi:hypothetical protein WMY93_000227 [Mugilogobius chulae]|uniref:t-SNARE coiled-coil homology domain-containing protein n=1 Tax=Mugilogobius chulae TaxID=88201 RepID=A0AAW0PYQ5_9GOBI
MSKDIAIHSWPGSYYLNNEKRWESGVLSLTRTMVRFVSNQSKESLAGFRLSRIVDIKMETSSFIFSTLTVLEEGNVKHWFETRGAESQPSKGRQLINLVAGAQKRLEDTGRVLSHQGEQFDNMMQGLEKMDSDLDVADKLLSELESPSWWPFGKLPWKQQQEAKAEDAVGQPPQRLRRPNRGSVRNRVISSIPAVVSKGADSDLKPGCLLVLVSSVEVRDTNCTLLHRFERSEVDEIRVHSPYEITVRQRFIGRPDVCFRLLSAKMPEALTVLEMQYKRKWNLVPSTTCSKRLLMLLRPTHRAAFKMLLQLKSLALEAETELERQDEVLDVLTNSADRTTMQIGKHTNRIKRLL